MNLVPFDIPAPPIPGWPPLASYAVGLLAMVAVYFAGMKWRDSQAKWEKMGQDLRQETADHKAAIDKKVAELVNEKVFAVQIQRVDEHLGLQDEALATVARNLNKLLIAQRIQPEESRPSEPPPPPRPRLPSRPR